MASISAELNRRIGILVDRAGRIEKMSVGDASRVEVPREPSAPSGRTRFCTLRFIATRIGDRELEPVDLAPIALHLLDALAIIAVNVTMYVAMLIVQGGPAGGMLGIDGQTILDFGGLYAVALCATDG